LDHCYKMEPKHERISFDDSESAHDTPSQRLPHREHEDAEKYLLLGEDSESVRRDSSRRPWSTKVLVGVTVSNIVLFLVSILMLSLSPRTSRPSDQDNWRATSYYCTYSPYDSKTGPLTLKRSSSIRPIQHPQADTNHEWYILGHQTAFNLACTNRRRSRRGMGSCGK
jgi:hypothetical protein